MRKSLVLVLCLSALSGCSDPDAPISSSSSYDVSGETAGMTNTKRAVTYLGKGDLQAGLRYLTKLSDEGSPSADLLLGDVLWEVGDYEKAMIFYHMAADAGHRIAMKYLATAYLKGAAVKQDYEKARHWYQKAADLRNLNSMVYLGIIYSKGLGVEKDYSLAYKWFTIAGFLKPKQESDKEPSDFAREIEGELTEDQIKTAMSEAQQWIVEHPEPDDPNIYALPKPE